MSQKASKIEVCKKLVFFDVSFFVFSNFLKTPTLDFVAMGSVLDEFSKKCFSYFNVVFTRKNVQKTYRKPGPKREKKR